MNPFTNYSMTGIGLVVVLVEVVLKLLGVELPEGSVSKTINDLVSGVGGVLVIFGQLRRKDLKWGFLRR